MKTKLLLFSLIITSILTAQTIEERDKMLKTYDLEKVNSLIEKLKIGEIEKEQMLEEYLASNPDVQREYYDDGKHYILYGIQENKPVYISTNNRKSAIATNTVSLNPGGDLGLDLEGEGDAEGDEIAEGNAFIFAAAKKTIEKLENRQCDTLKNTHPCSWARLEKALSNLHRLTC